MLTKLGLSLFELIAKQPKRSFIYAIVSQLCIIAWLDLATPNASLLQKYLDEMALTHSFSILTFSKYVDGEKQVLAMSRTGASKALPDGVTNVNNAEPYFSDWYQAHLSGNCWSYVAGPADKPSLFVTVMAEVGAKAVYACPVYAYGKDGKSLIGTIGVAEQFVKSGSVESKYLVLRGIAKKLSSLQ